jgi:hypothetical protein
VLNNTIPPDEGYSLQLTVGVQFGALHDNGAVMQVKRSGAAKILAIAGRQITTENIANIKPSANTEIFSSKTFLSDEPQENIPPTTSAAPAAPITSRAYQEPPPSPWQVIYTYTTSNAPRTTELPDKRHERVVSIGMANVYYSAWT